MHRKAMAVAVAAAFAAPAAFAQTTVTIGGTINIMWDTVKATGATQGTAFNVLSHDRVRDGAGSNIRFSVSEDLGGGNAAFVQVESAVIANADTRGDALGSGAVTSGWAGRNSAIGLRSKDWGRFLIGIWDLHFDEMYGIESGWLIANSSSSALSMWQNFGSAFTVNPSIGTRYSNVLRWDSPNWSGFSLTVGYARPTDGVPRNGAAASVVQGRKNRAWHLAARYETGGLQVRYAYLRDRDIPFVNRAATGDLATVVFGGMAGATFGAGGDLATSVHRVTSHRIGARYRFPMGLGIGFVYDSSKWNAAFDDLAVNNTVDLRRRSWAIPVTYETGNHGFYGTYGRAHDWRGSAFGVGFGAPAATATINAAIGGGAAFSLANDTGARFWTLGYTYRFSKRTNVHFSYNRVNNDALARYDFFANTAGTGAGNFGADPRSWAIGVRHTF